MDPKLIQAAEEIKEVFDLGHHGFTTMNHYGSRILMLVEFVLNEASSGAHNARERSHDHVASGRQTVEAGSGD